MTHKTLLSHYDLSRYEYEVMEELHNRESAAPEQKDYQFYKELIILIEAMDAEIGHLNTTMAEDCDCE